MRHISASLAFLAGTNLYQEKVMSAHLPTYLPACLPARQGWMELLGASASISGVSLVVVQLWSDLKALSPAGNSILSPPLVTV